MDGMTYFGQDDLTETAERKAAERREVRRAFITLALTIFVTIGSVLVLDWAGITLPVAEEFQSMPISGS